jgi:hypothetical protein
LPGEVRITPPHRLRRCRKLIGYLEGQRERVGYDKLRQRGLPRGNGGIESANTLIRDVRLKRSGAWRLEANGNAIGPLRDP